MTEALLVSNVVAWVVILVLAGVVVALVRQVGVLHERIAPVGALALRGGPEVGKAAPVVRAGRLDGGTESVGEARADGIATLVFFVSSSCPVCKELLPVVKSIARDERRWLRVVFATDGDRDAIERFAREHDLGTFPLVLSPELGMTYRVSKLPWGVLVDGSGTLRASGLVNTREHLESLFEAYERGVGSLQDWAALEGGPAEGARP